AFSGIYLDSALYIASSGIQVKLAANKLKNGLPQFEENYTESSISLLRNFKQRLEEYVKNVQYQNWQKTMAVTDNLDDTFPRNKEGAITLGKTLDSIKDGTWDSNKL